MFAGATNAALRACLRDRAAGRDPNTAPPSCAVPAVLALDADAVRSAQQLATLRNYAAAFVNALTWIVCSLFAAAGLVMLLPTVRVAAQE